MALTEKPHISKIEAEAISRRNERGTRDVRLRKDELFKDKSILISRQLKY